MYLMIEWPLLAISGAIFGLVLVASLRARRTVIAVLVLGPLWPLLILRGTLFVTIVLIDKTLLSLRPRLWRAAAEYLASEPRGTRQFD